MGLFGSLKAMIGGGAKAPSVSFSAGPAAVAQERQKKLDALSPGAQDESWAYREWQPVASSWIAALKYNPLGPTAYMRVKSGKEYTFGEMDFATFKAWLLAPSKGKYFDKNLKGRYTISRFVSVGPGIKAETSRAFGTNVLKELGIG